MLQQTQVPRVLIKYAEFLNAFPTWKDLAHAPTDKLLSVWKGMGYNRRALALRTIAMRVVTDFGGELPQDIELLESLPNIGPNTARSICAFAFNIPTAFIETNIRRIFIHFFFDSADSIHDKEILPLVEQTLDMHNPRLWYNALMDYGTMLKDFVPNPNRKSTHYAKQSKFEGSKREVRSQILDWIMKHHETTRDSILHQVTSEKWNVAGVLEDLRQEGFVKIENNRITLR